MTVSWSGFRDQVITLYASVTEVRRSVRSDRLVNFAYTSNVMYNYLFYLSDSCRSFTFGLFPSSKCLGAYTRRFRDGILRLCVEWLLSFAVMPGKARNRMKLCQHSQLNYCSSSDLWFCVVSCYQQGFLLFSFSSFFFRSRFVSLNHLNERISIQHSGNCQV